MRGASEEKKPHKMVRSSIACARCRRSKVKCVNNGPNSTCKSCAQSNRECTYPVAGSTPTVKRTEVLPGVSHIGEPTPPDSKKRNRKLEDSGRRVSQRIKEDVLDSPVLTRKVWDEIFELFKLHFSTEMPFLHPPTFRNRMRQAAIPRDPSILPGDLEECRVLLLGILTLTARFHPGLVAHHSPNSVDPIAASEFYAAPLATALGPTIRHLSRPSLENIQALLMLGLYEWGQTRGLSAWLHVGMALRLAYSMGLAYIDLPGNSMPSDFRTPLPSRTYPRDSAMFKEIRRRTLWSCFIMDQMISSGRNHPSMMISEKLVVQLPCSDDQFLFVRNECTSFLNPKWMLPNEKYISSQDEGVLSCYLRLVEIFGHLTDWTFAGGRRSETLPPWDSSSRFFELRQRLMNFHDNLPPSLTFTDANLSAHMEKRNATTYASLHTLYSLCLIVLHREYLPFVPLRCNKPIGPLDQPMFPAEKFNIPNDYWERCAKEVMKATRDIIYIIRTCQDSNALPESPQIGFAIWQAAFVCLYTLWFPKMDPEGQLVDSSCPDPRRGVKSKSLLALTRKILSDMVPTLCMMKSYLKSLDKIHRFYFTISRDYSVRFKREAEGLESPFKDYERDFKDLSSGGIFRDQDAALSETSDDQARSRASTNDIGLAATPGEGIHVIESGTQRQNGSWAPINASPSIDEERSRYTPRGQYPYGIPLSNQATTVHQSSVISNGGGINVGNDIALNSSGVTSSHPSEPPPLGSQALANVSSYTSISPSGMAPPTGNVMSGGDSEEDAFQKWIDSLESISMNTGLDNFAQETSMECFTRSGWNPTGSSLLNFLQATWFETSPVPTELEQSGS